MTGRWLRDALLRHAAPRRVVTITILLVFTGLAIALIPFVVVFAALEALAALALLRGGGRQRVLRFAVFLVVYLVAEWVGLVCAAALWVRSGFGRNMSEAEFQKANYALLARMLGWLFVAGERVYGLRILPPEGVDVPLPGGIRPGRRLPGWRWPGRRAAVGTTAPDLPEGPLLVFSRHGGPGDSFLLVHALLVHGHRMPRIVLKDTLAFNPLIDVALGRVPHCFVTPQSDDGATAAAAIGRLAATMSASDALVVFPEGGNFTARRRTRAIARLRRKGLRESANRAQRLRHVLPPRPAGVFAAIGAAPGADVVFVAHTGLDHMASIGEVWRGVPLSQPVEVTWWTIPADRVPTEEHARMRWLDDNWAEVDGWIDRHRMVPVPAEAEQALGQVPGQVAGLMSECAPGSVPAPLPASELADP